MLPVAILAGGLATRLQALTDNRPKSLLDILGEPFIAHQLRLLYSKGIERVVICVAHLGEMIQEAVGDGRRYGTRVEFSFDGPHLLGTAGAVKKALPLLGEAFFVIYGDAYLNCDYRAVQRSFEGCHRPALMTVFENSDRWDNSNVEFEGGRILAYDKTDPSPQMRHLDYGLSVFRRSAFQAVPGDGRHDLAAVFQDLLSRDQLAAHEVGERFYEIGSLEGLKATRRYLAAQRQLQPARGTCQ